MSSPDGGTSSGATPAGGPPSPASGISPEILTAVLDDFDHEASVVNAAGRSRSEVRRRAAVAAVFTAGPTDTELLFIQRATVPGDPWSGQMAFPGGRVEPTDRNLHATATRETAEEIDLDLLGSRHLGDLSQVQGGQTTSRLIDVSGHCYWLEGSPPSLNPNHEVADTLWVPLSDLLDHGRYIDYWYQQAEARFPGIQLNRPEQVIWGLTLRFLADLFQRLERGFII